MSEHFQYLKEGLVVDLVDRVMTEYHLDLEKALDVVYSSEISRNSPTLPPAFSKKARHTSTLTLKTSSEKEKFKQRVHLPQFRSAEDVFINWICGKGRQRSGHHYQRMEREQLVKAADSGDL